MSSPSADKPVAGRVPQVGASDYLRSVLAPIHQDEAASVALTVAVPAGIIHGHAVHPAVWLRRMAAEVRSRPGPEAGKDSIARIFEAHASRRDDKGVSAEVLMASINHLYLVDATLTSATPSTPVGRGTLWQVDLADVSAWTIGPPEPAALP